MRAGLRFVMVASMIVAATSIAPIAQGKIRDSDLRKNVVMTQEAALLQQADTVCLYLSSERASLVPRLRGDAIEVEITVLAPELASNRAAAAEFASRLAKTFLSVMEERLPIYAPDVAASFDAGMDVVFHANLGSSRGPLGRLTAEGWVKTPYVSASAVPPQQDAVGNQARLSEAPPGNEKGKACNCPARK